MPADTKELAEAVIKHLLLGAEVRGLRFGPQPDILFAGSAADKAAYLQPYLKLESRWTVVSSLPENPPDDESQLPEMSPEEDLELICSLGGDVVTAVRIGEPRRHLMFSLGSGRTILVNGYHERFECWEVGVSWKWSPDDTWLVVGGGAQGLDVYAPDWFLGEEDVK